MKQGNRYLLVDDDEIIGFMHPAIIRRVDPEAFIEVFRDPVEAMEYLQQQRIQNEPAPNYIFLDINMPFMNGFEFLSRLSTENRVYIANTKVIMLSSSIDSRDIEKAKSYPIIADFISKPLSMDYLSKLLTD
ncbi:MAG: response regulator [Bacteroidota bacterium]|jgi:two-component system chemotaxis response regulator CheY